MAEDQAKSSAKKKDFKMIFGLLFGVVNVAVVSGGAYLVYASTIGYHPKVSTETELNREIQSLRESLQTEPVVYTMETFNTNLEGLPRRFIRLEVSVEMYDQEGFEEIVTSGGESRDAIMRIVNSKTLDQIDSVQGKLALKTELISQVNQLLDRGVVKDLYFTKFQVQ